MKNVVNYLWPEAGNPLTSEKIPLHQPAIILFIFVLLQMLAGIGSHQPRVVPSSTPGVFPGPECAGLGGRLVLSNFSQSTTSLHAEPLFDEDSNVISIVWSVLWRIPWKAQFGKLFEWTPFFISLIWLVIWHLIMLVIHYSRSQKHQNASSLFYEFTKFVQIIYGFCCTQALL